MKKFDFYSTIKSVLILIGVSASMVVSAQQRVQLVHNSAAVALDTVDIYLDSIKFDNVAFRMATPIQYVAGGSHKIYINDRTSADTSDQNIVSFVTTVANNSNNIFMISGVDVPASYAANPSGRSTTLRLTKLGGAAFTTSSTSTVALSYAHGGTDVDAMSLKFRTGSSLVTNARFGDSSYFATAPANVLYAQVSTPVLDVMDVNSALIASYLVPLSSYSKKSLFLFTSGFADPSSNQNGAAQGLFAVDTNGGAAFEINVQASRLQIFNNAVDTTMDSIDVWLNNTKVISKLGFAKMAPIMSVASGTYDITFSWKNSTDTSTKVIKKMYGYNLMPMNTYLGMAIGAIDTAKYSRNPDGLSTYFTIVESSSYREVATSSSQVELAFVNAGTDAPILDINSIAPTLQKLADNSQYSVGGLNYASITPGKYIISLTDKDSTLFYSTHLLNLTGMAGNSGILFTAGIKDTLHNPKSAPRFKLYIGWANGTVQEVKPLKSTMQIINNSADSTCDTVDIYVNNVKLLTNGLGFRNATPFMNVAPYTPYVVAVAPKHSTSVADAFYTKSFTIDSVTGYYAVIAGLRNTTGYAANPEGLDRSFTIHSINIAKTKSSATKNVDLLYYNGSTDLMKTTMMGYNGTVFISKNDSYGAFHTPYSPAPGLDNLEFPLSDANEDTLLLPGIVGSISDRVGQTGLVFTSGFYTNLVNSNDTNKIKTMSGTQLQRVLGLYLAWMDGDIDTVQKPQINTGIDDKFVNEYHTTFYPNPANDNLHIAFELTTSGKVSAELYDINGRLVTSTSNKFSGKGEIVMNVQDMVSGIYFCSLTIDGQRIVRKVSIVK